MEWELRRDRAERSACGIEVGSVRCDWAVRDVILYALGTGARVTDEPPYLYEGVESGIQVAPTFALTACNALLPACWTC